MEKWEELRELAGCVESFESGPGSSRGARRIRQRLTHLSTRLQNLCDQWGTLEHVNEIKAVIEQVTSTLQVSQTSQVHTPEAVPASGGSGLECSRESTMSAPVFSGMVAASYNKLPNPLSQVIQQLPVVDGLDVDKLIPFFKIIFQIADFPGMSDRALLELIYPYRCV